MSLPNHGANPQLLYSELAIPLPEQIIDYSENVNPLGPPLSVVENWQGYIHLLSSYPEPHGEPFLSAIAAYHGIPKSRVLLGNGAAEIFSLLAGHFQRKCAMIVHPTFSEYEATLRANGTEIIHLSVEEIENWKLPIDHIIENMKRADLLYLCTPNNPTGVLPPRNELVHLLEEGQKMGCTVILDEAFIDWIGEESSMISYIEDFPNLIIVRSMTKMYAIPGIRLGYMVSSPALIEALREKVPHWHINGIAAHIGAKCIDETHYREKSIEYAKKSKARFVDFLRKLGCKTTKSVTNYVCFKLPHPDLSQRFFHDMLNSGIVLRHTENFKGLDGKWFRVGMKNEQAMAVLQEEMEAWIKQNSHL